MGTNYYFELNKCETCGRADRIHLGKSSLGWNFLLQTNDLYYIGNWQEMKKWILEAKGNIVDEYGRRISKQKFIELVESWKGKSHSNLPGCFEDKDGYDFCSADFS